MALALGPEIYARGFRFSPTPQEAVTYYLPRLVSGDPGALHEVVRPVIHRAAVYACEPAELARRFCPMPRTHDRFFFTVVKKGVRAAGPGSWAVQSTVEIKDKGVQVGELRKFRYKKRSNVFTDWLMEEYSSCRLDDGAAAGGGGGGMQPVLCKVYVSPRAAPNSDAYKESAACFAPPPPDAAPGVITQQPAAAKRPVAPSQDAMPPCAKRRMRCPAAAVQSASPPLPPAPPAPTTAVQKMPGIAPPQPYAPRRGPTTPSATQPSPASAPPPAPPAPTRPPLVAVRKMSFAPPKPCPPRRGLTTPLATATQPSPASAPPPAPPAPARPAAPLQPRGSGSPMPLPTPRRPLAQPKQQPVPLPATPPVALASASHMPQMLVQPKQRRTVLDPLEADMLRDRAEAEEQMVAAAKAKLQDDDDDDLAKVIEDMLSADAEEPLVAALEFDVDAFFNLSEEN